jgi:hypothetical protein
MIKQHKEEIRMKITAEEARRLATENSVNLEDIYHVIEVNAKLGRRTIRTTRSLTQAEIDLLVLDGFEVVVSSEKGKYYRIIRW